MIVVILYLNVCKAIKLIEWVASSNQNESHARRATSILYHTSAAVLMAWEGAKTYNLRGDARRILWSWLVVQHRLSSLDPFETRTDLNEGNFTEILLGSDKVTMSEVSKII